MVQSIAPAPPAGAPGVAQAVKALLRYLHRQSPVRGGSLLITIFGDAIAPRGGAIALGSLIELARPFALAERLVRTSVARLASDGWLVARRDGRRSEYRLAPWGAQRFADATRRIYGMNPSSWEGHWTLLVLPPAAGGRPQNVRDELRWLGFGQVSPGVFVHPNWTVAEARAGLAGIAGAEQGLLFKSSSEGEDGDLRLVATGWDLEDLARRYRKFLEVFAPAATAVAAEKPAGEAAFVIRTLLIHEYRKIHLQDPLLPPALLPADWVGTAAYELSRQLYSAVFDAAESYLSTTASRMTEPLPPLDPLAYQRFGGLSRPQTECS